jgi:hypothetical protein
LHLRLWAALLVCSVYDKEEDARECSLWQLALDVSYQGPWTIIEAGVARGRKIASWPSLKTALRNAGAAWVNAQVTVDGKLVSSQKPDEIPAFNQEDDQFL